MSEPRFRVTSCIGYEINPLASMSSGNTRAKAASSWQVLDSGVNFELLAEWSAPAHGSSKYCEEEARAFAAELTAWDEAGGNEPAPRPNRQIRSRRPEARREENRRAKERRALRSTGGPLPEPHP